VLVATFHNYPEDVNVGLIQDGICLCVSVHGLADYIHEESSSREKGNICFRSLLDVLKNLTGGTVSVKLVSSLSQEAHCRFECVDCL
jgi:hypothetical protein